MADLYLWAGCWVRVRSHLMTTMCLLHDFVIIFCRHVRIVRLVIMQHISKDIKSYAFDIENLCYCRQVGNDPYFERTFTSTTISLLFLLSTCLDPGVCIDFIGVNDEDDLFDPRSSLANNIYYSSRKSCSCGRMCPWIMILLIQCSCFVSSSHVMEWIFLCLISILFPYVVLHFCCVPKQMILF